MVLLANTLKKGILTQKNFLCFAIFTLICLLQQSQQSALNSEGFIQNSDATNNQKLLENYL